MTLANKMLFIASVLLIVSCKNEMYRSVEINAERIAIDTSIAADSSITNFIEPYKEHLNKTLDSALAYNPEYLSKNDGDLNTAIGNLMADIVMEQANPIFKKRTGKDIDMVLLNHGGIRAAVNQGEISARTAYALMPFENEIVITELAGEKIFEILSYLEDARTAHPVSGIQITMDKNYNVTEAKINNEEISKDKTYFVATSDYLQQGGDNMSFFEDPEAVYSIDYKLRNALIDYFKKVDTLQAETDKRFIRLK